MTKENNDSLIGYDPLAWINNDDKEEDVIIKSAGIIKEATIPEVIVEETPEIHQEEPIFEEYNDSNIILSSNLNIKDVSKLHNQLLSVLQKHQAIDIDASEVEIIDTASLQLLVLLKQEALKLDKNIVFDFPSDKFIDSATQLGLCDLLGLDQVAAGFF